MKVVDIMGKEYDFQHYYESRVNCMESMGEYISKEEYNNYYQHLGIASDAQGNEYEEDFRNFEVPTNDFISSYSKRAN